MGHMGLLASSRDYWLIVLDVVYTFLRVFWSYYFTYGRLIASFGYRQEMRFADKYLVTIKLLIYTV